MIDDCRYPEGMIASPYWERPMSILPVETGSMPGAIPKPEYFDILPGGRGCIPGTGKFLDAVTLGLVTDRRYPDADVYEGPAHEGTIAFHSPRLAFLNSVIEWVATKVVEKTVASKGGRMLTLQIWVEKDTWGILPTYRWTLLFNFYIPTTAGVVPLSASLIISGILFLLAGIIVFLILKQVKEIIWGPPDKPGIISLALIGGAVVLGFMALKPKPTKKKS